MMGAIRLLRCFAIVAGIIAAPLLAAAQPATNSSASPPVLISCDSFLRSADPTTGASAFECAALAQLVVTGNCSNATLIAQTRTVLLDITACRGPVSIIFDTVSLSNGPSIAVWSAVCDAGMSDVAVTVRSSSLHATRSLPPSFFHPLGPGTVSLFDVISTCGGKAGSVSIAFVASAVTVTSSINSGGASVGTLFLCGVGVAAAQSLVANLTTVEFVADSSVLSATGGSGGAAVLSIFGGGEIASRGLSVAFVVISVRETAALADRGGTSGGNSLCGVLLIRCDAGVAVAWLSASISSNSTLASTALYDGWVGTVSVMAANGSASLTASEHTVSSSSLSAVGGLAKVAGNYFIESVAAVLAVVAGMCDTSTSAAAVASPRWAVWGEVEVARGIAPTAPPATTAPSAPLLLLTVIVAASNLTAFTALAVAAVLSAMMYSEACAFGYPDGGLSRLGAIPPNATSSSGAAAENSALLAVGIVVVVVTNGSYLAATTTSGGSGALLISSAVGFGSGTAQFGAVGPASLVVVANDSTLLATASKGMALVVAAGVLSWGGHAPGQACFTAAGGALVAVAGAHSTVRAAAGLAMAASIGAIVWNNHGYRGDLGEGGVWWRQGDGAVVVWGGSAVAATIDDKLTNNSGHYWASTAVALGVGGVDAGNVTVDGGPLVWIVAGSTLSSSQGGIVMGFGALLIVNDPFALNVAPNTTLTVLVCSSTIVNAAGAALLGLYNLTIGGRRAAPVPPWWTVALCNGTVLPLSNPDDATSSRCAIRTLSPMLDAGGSSTAAFDGVASNEVGFFLSMLVGTDKVPTMPSSACGAALYGSNGVMTARRVMVWARLLSMLPGGSAPAATSTTTTTAPSTTEMATATAMTTIDTTLSTLPTGPTATPRGSPQPTLPALPTTTVTVTSSKPATTTALPTTAPGLVAVATAAAAAASHVAAASTIAALLSSPQSASRGPQAIRLATLRSTCRTRLTNDALASIESPDPKQYVWVVDFAGGLALGALVSTAGLEVATLVAALTLGSSCGRNWARRTVMRGVATLHVAAMVYYGPNVVSGAGAVLTLPSGAASSTVAGFVGILSLIAAFAVSIAAALSIRHDRSK